MKTFFNKEIGFNNRFIYNHSKLLAKKMSNVSIISGNESLKTSFKINLMFNDVSIRNNFKTRITG